MGSQIEPRSMTGRPSLATSPSPSPHREVRRSESLARRSRCSGLLTDHWVRAHEGVELSSQWGKSRLVEDQGEGQKVSPASRVTSCALSGEVAHAVTFRHDRQLLLHRFEHERALEICHADANAVTHPAELFDAQRGVEGSPEPTSSHGDAARDPVSVPVVVAAMLAASHVEDDLIALISRESDLHLSEGSDSARRSGRRDAARARPEIDQCGAIPPN
jgi:hypothetical protein